MDEGKYSPGQLIKFRRKMSEDSSEYFDSDWKYGICSELYTNQTMEFFGEQGCFGKLMIGKDDIQTVPSLDVLLETQSSAISLANRKEFYRLAKALEGRVQQGKSICKS